MKVKPWVVEAVPRRALKDNGREWRRVERAARGVLDSFLASSGGGGPTS
jgi:hypothetical protein